MGLHYKRTKAPRVSAGVAEAFASEDVDTGKGLVRAQVVLHKHLVLAGVRQLRVLDGQDGVGVSDVEEHPGRQLEHLCYRRRVLSSG